MANFNKVMLIGRLTRDPETRAFANGGMVTKIGFAVLLVYIAWTLASGALRELRAPTP